MEVGAATSALNYGYTMRTQAPDGVAARVPQATRDARSDRQDQQKVADAAANANTVKANKDPRELRDAQKASAAAVSNTQQIQFKDSEGTRVMEVFDSKNVLIYQVPPKGLIMLIHSQEKQHATQLETTA